MDEKLYQWLYVTMRECETKAARYFVLYEEYRQKKWPAWGEYQSHINAKNEAAYYRQAMNNLLADISQPLFVCDAGMIDIAQETIDFGSDEVSIPFTRYEEERLFSFVSAPTRGKAKMLFLQQPDANYLEWTSPLSIRKMLETCLPDGIAPWEVCDIFPLWSIVDERGLLPCEDEIIQEETP